MPTAAGSQASQLLGNTRVTQLPNVCASLVVYLREAQGAAWKDAYVFLCINMEAT